MSDQENEQQEGTQTGEVAPPSVEPLTPQDSDAPAPEPVGQTDETVNPEGDDAQTDTEATAPTQPGDEGVPFRPSSDFEEAAEQMPVPIGENAAGIDLSQRAVASTAIVGSPALAAETIVAQITVNTDEQIVSGIMLRGFVAFTVGTSGTATTLRLRRTNVAGTVVATTGALTGGVAAGNLVADTILGFDTNVPGTGQVYVLTLQVTGGAAASTVSAVELDALVV